METNVIHNQECLQGMSERIEDNSIDMILADLPYGTTACSWDSIIPLEPLWEQYKRVIKDNGAIVLTASQPFTTKLISSNMGWFRYEWIWDKKRISNPMLAKKQPLKQHENICVFYKKQPNYNPQPYKKNTVGLLSNKNLGKNHSTEVNGKNTKLTTSNNKNQFGYPRSLITQIPVMNNLSSEKNGLHPTQKPVALFEYLIKTYTNKGEIVLDNVIGSGTTAVACLKTYRKFIGFEQEEEYYNIALKRIGKFDKRYYDELPKDEKPKQSQLF